MDFINRWILIIKPKEPFLNWLKSIPGHDPELTLTELREDPTTILIPELEDDDEVDEFINKNYKIIFESELLSSDKNKAYWPKNLTIEVLREWFEISSSSIVLDFLDQDIEKN